MRTSFPVDAPPAAWANLADPAVLAAVLPGCRSVTPGDGGALRVAVHLSVASVRGLWAGTVRRVDADAVRIQGSGEPGAVDLVARADAARTTLTVEGTVDGPLASVGSAVLAAAVRRTAEEMLAAVADRGLLSVEPVTPGDPAEGAFPGSARGTGAGGDARRIAGRVAAGAAAVLGVVVIVRRRRRARREAA